MKLNTAAFSGHTHWRLPTRAGLSFAPTGQPAELESIVETGHGAPTINSIFGPTTSSRYWSSSTDSRNLQRAWNVNFSDGGVLAPDKGFAFSVRAARGGP